MVLFAFPSGYERSNEVGMQLYPTRTLFGLLPVNDRAQAVKAVLSTGITVVIPDDATPNDVWLDVLTALRACHHPVRTVADYLNQLRNAHQPAAGAAAPPTQQEPVAGLTL